VILQTGPLVVSMGGDLPLVSIEWMELFFSNGVIGNVLMVLVYSYDFIIGI
jgi:hypothetical protein